MSFHIVRLDHVQLAAPEGCEQAARHFYGKILGFVEIEKPPLLRARGGCWFQCGEQQVHIGVERNFHAAKKADPAFAVTGFDKLREYLLSAGISVVDDYDAIPGTRRFHADDRGGTGWNFLKKMPDSA